MFGLSGDHASQVTEKDEEEEEQQQLLLLGGARKSHVGLLQAFATGEQLSPGRVGGSSVESLLQGSSSSSEMTAEGVDGSGLICNSAMEMDRSCLEQLTTVGASILSTDMLRENLEIMAQSELEIMSPGASEPTVSDSSGSRTSGQNVGRVFFSHLQLAGGPDTAPDQCTLEPTVFRAPLHVSGETWRGGESSDGIVCSEGDVIYYPATTTPQMQKLQYPVSQGILGTPLTYAPIFFPFPGTQVISEAQAKAMMIPAADLAMRPILTFGGGAPAAAIPPSSSRTLLGPEMELLSASRPKRRNVRISKDPQSVAARHQREQISDRIRMLQRLVPGGTKMDTASLLDEANHYVKFLKLQLQVLEQLGNSFDSNLTMERMPPAAYQLLVLSPQSGVALPKPFDLNCSAYNQVAHDECLSANVLHSSSTTGSDHHITGWSSRTSLSSMCLPDHAHEREPQTAIEASLQAATEERGLRAAAEPQQCQLGNTCSDSQNTDALLEGVEVAFSEVENVQVETGPNYTFSTGKNLADLAEAYRHGGIAGFLAEANLMRALSSMLISKNPTGIAMAELSRQESSSRSMNEQEESSVVESLLADWNAARGGALINTAFQQCSVKKLEEDLLASIQVNDFGMTPHWYKEVTHTAPKYKGVAHMNKLDKGSSDSEGGDANGGGHDIQMTQQEQQGLDGKKIQSQDDMLNQSGHRTKRHTCHEQTSTNTKSSGSRDLERVTAKRVKILEDPSEQQKLLPSMGINETLQNRLLELERLSILIVGRKDIQGDFVEFQFLSPESMAKVVGVGLQWSRVMVTSQFNVIVTYVGNKAWLNFWKEARQKKDSKMFTLLRGTIPRVSTKLEAVSNLTAKESSRRFGVGLEEVKSEIHNVYVKDNTKQNGMLPLIFELTKHMGVSGENARNSGKQHSGASSSGYAGGKSDDKRAANPNGKTQIPGDGNHEDKEGEESELPSSNPSKLPAEPPLDTKKNKSLTVTVIPESGGTFHQRSTNNLAYPEGPIQHAAIVPWLQFKFEMLGDYDDRRITTTTTTQCNLGGGEPKYPDLDCGYYHDNITISLDCEKQKAARLKSATVDATNSGKRTISTTFTGSRSSANQISGQFGGTFQIPIVDIGVQAQGNVSRIGTIGDSDSLANSNETLNNLFGGFYVNPAGLEGNLIYNFLHPEDMGELLLKNRKQFLHSGICRTFWPTIVGEWDTLDMDETCMYSFKTERDITSVEDLMKSNVARNIPYYMRQRYQVPLYINHAMTHIHCYEMTTLQGAGEQRLEHVLIKYPAF